MTRIEAIDKESEILVGEILSGKIPHNARCFYAGRNSLYDIMLPSGRRVCAKVFRRNSAFRGMIYALFATPKSKKSYQNAQKILSLGFQTPAPLAHGELYGAGGMRLKTSVYICEMLQGAREIRNWQDWPDRDEMVNALGGEMARLMKAGVLFRDFSPGNVMLVSSAPYQFSYVDVNRTDFNVRSRRKMMSMFKRINIVPSETERIALATAREMGWNERETAQKALQIVSRFLWMKDEFLHPIKNFFKKIVKK